MLDDARDQPPLLSAYTFFLEAQHYTKRLPRRYPFVYSPYYTATGRPTMNVKDGRWIVG